MGVIEIVAQLESAGGTLQLAGSQIRYRIPADDSRTRDFVLQLRGHRQEVAAFLKERNGEPQMPTGVRLLGWNLKKAPVAVETCAVVTDTALFARSTLEQLGTALAQRSRWVGWSVPQLIDRLAQVGVTVKLAAEENNLAGESGRQA
jgi:hypothetical protein